MTHNRFRYREKWAHGPGEWEYADSSEAMMEDRADELMMVTYALSDHYRGLEWEQIESPPVEWLTSESRRLREIARWACATADDYDQILNSLGSNK